MTLWKGRDRFDILARALSIANIHLMRERPGIPLPFPGGDRAAQSVRSSIQQ